MKVSQVAPNEEKDGITKYTKDLISALEKEGLDVKLDEIKQPENGNPLHWKNFAESIDSDVTHVQFEYGVFGNIKDRIHGLMAIPFYRNLNTKIVTTLHSVDEREPKGLKDDIKEIFLSKTDQTIYNRSDAIIVHSKESKELLLEKGVNEDKVNIVNHGVRKGEQIEKEEAKKELGLECDKIALLFGFIRRSKGYKKAIRAIQDTEYHLLIAGSTQNESQEEYRKELKDLVENLGLTEQVHFIGYVQDQDIKYVMNASDVLILPYRGITGSGVFTLGISYEIPILASKLEYFKEKEQENLLKTFETEEQLSQILAHDKFKKTDDMKNYRENSSWEQIAEKTINIYENII